MTDLPPTERSARRWTRVLLPVSLGFNLAIIGIFGGLVLSHLTHPPREPVRELSFGRFTDALTPQERQDLRRAFFQQAPGFRAERAAMRADFQNLIGALKAEPYDPAKVAELMDRQDARTRQWIGLGQRLLQDRIAAMSPAERAAFADRLEKDMERRLHRAPPPPPPGGQAAATAQRP